MTMRPEQLFADELEVRDYDAPDTGDSQDQLRVHWVECMRGKEQVLSDIELGTKVMTIVDLATRSLWDGRAYRFDPHSLKAHSI